LLRNYCRRKSFFKSKLLDEPQKAVKVYDGWVEITEPYVRTKIQKFVRFVKNHPKGFTGSLAFAGLIFVLLVYTSTVKTKDNNPSYAWVENQVLYVQNENAELLWKKSAPGIQNTNSDVIIKLDNYNYLLVKDVDNDKVNEVLLWGDTSNDDGIPSDSIFCYDNMGKIKWKTGGWDFPEFNTKRWRHTRWCVSNMIIVKDNYKKNSRLFVVIYDLLYSPSILLELDGKNGKVIQRFYNVGGTNLIYNFDIDEDGQNEIIIGGVNDPFKRAYIAVFDINNVTGFSPSSEHYLPSEVSFGSYKYYLLFPFTKLGGILGNVIYNNVKYLIRTKESLIVATEEVLANNNLDHRSSVLYSLDNEMNVQHVTLGDDFIKSHKRLVEEERLSEKLDSTFFENLKNSVKYWDGEKFVDSVSVNKYYNFSSVDLLSLIR
jgi:hypothetical protein